MYGGTKAELERLIADAASYTDIQKEMGITVDATSMSFDNIVNAIAVVQGHLGIAGATAAEAATTIEGSVNMMKASWSNLTTALANENADVGAHIDEFVGTVGTVVDNVMPRVEIALEGVGKLVNGIIPKFAEALPTMIAKYVPTFLKAGVNILQSLVKGIKDNVKMIVTAGKDLIISLIDGLGELIPDVIDAGVELLSGVVEAVPEVAIKLAQSMPKIIAAVSEGLVKGSINVAKAAIGIFVPIEDASATAMENLRSSFEDILPFTEIVEQFAQNQVDLSKAISESGKTLADIDQDISEVEGKITDIIKVSLENNQKLRDQDIENIKAYNKKIKELENERLSIYRDQQVAELRKAQLDIATADAEGIAQILGKSQAALDAANEAVEQAYSDRLIFIENEYKALGEVGSKAYYDALADAKEARDNDLEINKQYYNQVVALAAGQSTKIASLNLSAYEKLSTKTKEWKEVVDLFGDSLVELGEQTVFADETVAKYIEDLEALDEDAAIAFLATQAEMIEAGQTIDEKSMQIVQTIIDSFEELPGEIGEASTEAMRQLAAGLESKIPGLKNSSQMTVNEIKGVFSSYFSQTNGNAVATTFTSGIKSGLSGLPGAVRSALDALYDPFGNGRQSFYGEWWLNGSKASGLGYVPFDGYVAELHKGERVLTAQEARNYANPGYGIGSVSITINGASYTDEESLADAIADRLYDMTMEGVEAFA